MQGDDEVSSVGLGRFAVDEVLDDRTGVGETNPRSMRDWERRQRGQAVRRAKVERSQWGRCESGKTSDLSLEIIVSVGVRRIRGYSLSSDGCDRRS